MDYNKPITSKDIDLVKYHNKFKLVDEWRKTGSEELFSLILKDVTMFSYTFFRINGNPVRLYPYQDLILNDKHRYKIFRSARQLGKSLALDIKSAYNLCINHGKGHNESIISKSLPQATFQMRRVKMLLNSMPKLNWKDRKGDSDSMSVVTVDIKDENDKSLYTNMLVVAPCTEGALGYDFDEVNLDETEYWDVDLNNFWNNIIEPTTYATRGNMTSFSNPNGSDTYIAELESLTDKNGNKKFHVYVFDFMDRPGATLDDLEEAKLGKTRQQIESQLLAIRSISDRNFFTNDEIDRSYSKTLTQLNMVGKQSFFFLDVGSKHDQSVLVGGYIDYPDGDDGFGHIYIPIIHCYPVGYPISRVVGSYSSEQDSDGWHVEKSVKDYLDEWGKGGIIPVFGVDVTGNSGISPLFETINIAPEDITFSGPVKSGMYQRFKYFMEKGLLHRIKSAEFEYQAKHLEVKKTARGYLSIHHANENDLDDVMDGVGGLIRLIDPSNTVPVSMSIIGKGDKK